MESTTFEVEFLSDINEARVSDQKYGFIFVSDKTKSCNSYDVFFNLFYKPKGQKINFRYYIGEVKLCCQLNNSEIVFDICDEIINNNPSSVWMIGNQEFYNNLINTVDEKIIDNFLIQMNDIVYDPKKLSKLQQHINQKNKNVIQDGLLNDKEYQTMYRIATLIYGHRNVESVLSRNFLRIPSFKHVYEYINQEKVAPSKIINNLLYIAREAKENNVYKNILTVFCVYILSTRDKNLEDALKNVCILDVSNIMQIFSSLKINIEDQYIKNAQFYLTLVEIYGLYNEDPNMRSLVTLIKDILDDECTISVASDVNYIKDVLRVTVEDVCGNKQFKLGQYTSLSTLRYLIKPKKNNQNNIPSLRLSNLRQMNDPTEGTALLECFGEVMDNNTKIKIPFKDNGIYVSSMTSVLDSLPMWKLYADDAQGVSMVYSSAFLKKVIKKTDADIFRMCYISKNKYTDGITHKDSVFDVHISRANKEVGNEINFENLSDKEEKIRVKLNDIYHNLVAVSQHSESNIIHRIMKIIDNISYLFKYSYYSYENEFRLVRDLGSDQDDVVEDEYISKNNPIPFLRTYLYILARKTSVSYEEVKLGCKSLPIDYVAPYIKYCDENIEVTKSEVPYR